MKKQTFEHVGDYDGYQVYKNKDGFLEGFKKTGKMIISQGENKGTDCKRVVSNQKTMSGFIEYINGFKKKKPKIKDIPLKPSDLPSLFEGDN